MTARLLAIGAVITAQLPQQLPNRRGQGSYRPAVVLAAPNPTGSMQYPMLIVAPLTTDKGQSWIVGNPLYIRLQAGAGGLPVNSVVLLDQMRALNVTHITRLLGVLSAAEYAPIQQGLQGLLKL